mmetsp:Transcript_5146/g.8490  ORF Transcript_5146/g.8490 Transcript_5146/m.8490 type:complete len:941 (-) Transcript_5146:66-2888(-)
MDLEAFSDEDFNVKKWVNETLKRGNVPDENLESYVGSLVLKLQLLSQDLNRSLEEIGTRAVQNLPKTLREIERLKSEASALKSSSISIGGSLKQVEEETRECVATIAAIDTIKHKMEVSVSVLSDAENVAKVARDMDRVFQSGDLQAIAEHLGAMQRSVKALKDVPEFDEYKQQAKEMQQKLESMVSQKLIEALEKRNQEGARTYRDVLDKIGRLDAVQEYYISSRQKALLSAWASYTPPAENVPEGVNNYFARWLATFYDHTLSFISSESSWCGSVFPDQKHLIAQLVTTSLNGTLIPYGERVDSLLTAMTALHIQHTHTHHHQSLSPPPSNSGTTVPNSASTMSQLQPDVPSSLDFLIEVFSLATGFAIGAREILQKFGADENALDMIVLASTQPYVPYQRDYRALESAHLSHHLSDYATTQDGDGLQDNVRAAEESVGRVFNVLTFAVDRCIEFTGGTEAEALADAVTEFFGQYTTRLFGVIKRVRRLCHLDPDLPVKHLQQPLASSVPSSSSGGLAQPSSGPGSNSGISVAGTPQGAGAGAGPGTGAGAGGDVGLSSSASNKPPSSMKKGGAGAGAGTGTGTGAGGPSAPHQHEHDWSEFQASLQLLSAGRSIVARLHQLDSLIRTRLLEQRDVLLPHAPPAQPHQPQPVSYAQSMSAFHSNAPTHTSDSSRSSATISVHAIRLKNDKERASRLRSVLRRFQDSRFVCLSSAATQVQSVHGAFKSLVYDSGFCSVKERLQRVSSLEVWSSEPAPSLTGLLLPSFSLSPLEYITQIGEHLLTLPQQLEPFAAAVMSPHHHSLSSDSNHNSAAAAHAFPDEAEEAENEERSSAFAHGWITSIAKGTVSLYVEQILQISSITPHGARQLSTDIGYLINVLSALGVTVDLLLLSCQQMLSVSKEEFLDVVEDTPSIDKKTARIFAAMRGISWKQFERGEH